MKLNDEALVRSCHLLQDLNLINYSVLSVWLISSLFLMNRGLNTLNSINSNIIMRHLDRHATSSYHLKKYFISTSYLELIPNGLKDVSKATRIIFFTSISRHDKCSSSKRDLVAAILSYTLGFSSLVSYPTCFSVKHKSSKWRGSWMSHHPRYKPGIGFHHLLCEKLEALISLFICLKC